MTTHDLFYKRSGDSFGLLIFQRNGFRPASKIVRNQQDVFVAALCHRQLQNIHGYHFKWSAHWNRLKVCSFGAIVLTVALAFVTSFYIFNNVFRVIVPIKPFSHPICCFVYTQVTTKGIVMKCCNTSWSTEVGSILVVVGSCCGPGLQSLQSTPSCITSWLRICRYRYKAPERHGSLRGGQTLLVTNLSITRRSTGSWCWRLASSAFV